MCAPLIGSLEIGEYLDTGQIEQVIAGGENYGGARPCRFEWIQSLNRQCRRRDITFAFIETGTNFVKDGQNVSYAEKIPAERDGVSLRDELPGETDRFCSDGQFRTSRGGGSALPAAV